MICCGRDMISLKRKIDVIEILQAVPYDKEDYFLELERNKGKKINIH